MNRVVNEREGAAKSIGSAAAAKASGGAATIESVADIIDRDHQNVIEDWLARVEGSQT
jgi:hypothetical protein